MYESDIPVFLHHISRIWSLSGAKVMPKRPNMESQTAKVRPKVPNMEPPSAKVEPKGANMKAPKCARGARGSQHGEHRNPIWKPPSTKEQPGVRKCSPRDQATKTTLTKCCYSHSLGRKKQHFVQAALHCRLSGRMASKPLPGTCFRPGIQC